MEKFYLKDHNAVAYEKIKARFEQDNMCAIVHATGTGKTYLGLKLAIDNPTKKVLFVVPRLNIKEHIQDTINNSKVQDDEIYDVENLDEEIENIEEIESEGTAEDIKAMAKRMGVSIKNVKFITYQALIRRDLKQLKEIDADYIIFDEMHHLGAEHWGKAGKDLVLTHPQAKVLGMSAFDVWSPGNNFAGYKIATTQAEQEALNGTSDENTPFFKGAVVSKIDLADAIMQGILPEPNYYLGLELFEELKELRDLRVSGKIDNKTAKEIDLMIGTYEELAEESENCSNVSIYSTNITANIYDGYTPRIFNSQALRFLESKVNKDTSAIYFSKKGFVPGTDKRYLDSAEEFCRDNLNIPFVSFKTTADDKDGELMRKAFAKGKDVKGDDIALDAKIMFAIDQYGEGTHIQNVNMVILDKKTLSPIVWGENIGRALHSIEGAENPTILDLAGNVDMVLSVIDKLKANGYLPPQRSTGKERDIFGLTVKEIDLLQRLQNAKQRLATFLEGDYAWNINFKRLNEFVKVNGRYPIKGANNMEEKSLGDWVGHQRQAYKDGKLSKERIEKLNSINFIWNQKEEKWQENFIALKEFLEENNRYPRMHSKYEEERSLGIWSNNQRQAYKDGRLSQKRIDALNSIGFVWFVDKEEQWQESFIAFKEFVKENNRYPSQASQDKDEKFLSLWVRRQRQAYKEGTLSKERIEQLNKIGFIWDAYEQKWQENFAKFKEFVKEKNRYPSETAKDEEERFLGRWVSEQRKVYKEGTLSKERIEQLNKIGFIWEPLEQQWQENFIALKEFLEENNRYPTTCSKDEEERSLANWVLNQRKAIKNGKISLTRFKMLKRIKFVVDTKEEKTLAKANKEFFEMADDIFSR